MIPPKWPDFDLVEENGMFVAATDTGRPRTPYFYLRIVPVGLAPTAEFARQLARRELDAAFRRAHPNGCPGR